MKPESRATTERHKAPLVAKGFQQLCGADFNQTYASVARMTSIHLLLAHGHTRRLFVPQVDVKDAVLNGHLDEKIYMRQPKRFVDNRHP